MESTPLSRRPAAIGLFGSGLLVLAYALTLRALEPLLPTDTLLSKAIFLLGVLLNLLVLSGLLNRLFVSTTQRAYVAALLRMALFLTWLALNLVALFNLGANKLQTAVLHLDVSMIVLLVVLAVGAQFVLPVRSLAERIAVTQRVFSSLVGEHGPVTFIRNGQVYEAHDERQRRAAGVFLVDHTSAAVLRTDTQFTRAIGPGVHFSQRGEWLAEPLDLRPQKRRARGHKPSTDQPPAPEGVSTQALTHDGIPIATDLSVTFMLDPGHRQVPRSGRREDRSPYEYNPVSAERAVYAHAYGEFEDLPWTALPLRLAVDLWREIVKTYTLEKLLGQDRGTIPPMQQIKARIETRLSSATVDVLDSHGRRVAQESREFQILAARGVRVLAVGGMTALYLPDDIRLERTRIWQEKWAGSIQSSLAQADEQVRQARRDGELKAGELLLRDLTRELAGELSSNRAPGRRDTLRLVLQSAIRLCAHHPELLDRSALSMQLTEVLRELETLDDDCRAVGSGGAG